MKKYIIGAIIVIMLSTSYSVSAEVINMIGKKVDGSYPFKINGKQANKDVIVIQGTSYIPVRAAAELFGYDIDLINNEVHMQSKKFKGLSPFEQAIRSMNNYKLTSQLNLNLGPDTHAQLLEIDGNSYIPLTPSFGKYLSYEPGSEILTITFNNHTITAPKTTVYTKDIDLISEGGILFVKLSALGLKAIVQGDTLIIQ